MRVGLISLPFGLFGTLIFIFVLVLFANAMSKSRNASRTLLAAFAVLLILMALAGVFFGYMRIGASRSVHYQPSHTQSSHVEDANSAAVVATEQAREATEQVKANVKAVEARVKQVEKDIQARVDAGMSRLEQDVLNLELIPAPADPPSTVSVSTSPKPAEVSTTVSEPVVTQTTGHTGVTIVGDAWSDAVEVHQDFEADVYPSIETAAEALGRNVGRDLMEHAPSAQAQNNTPVYVWMPSDDQSPAAQDGVLLVTRPVLEAVAEGIRQKLVNPDVVSVERPTVQSSPDQNVTVVRVTVNDVVFDNHNRWGRHTESGSGFLLAEVDTPDFDFSRNMRFEQAPWVADPSRFADEYKNGHWLVTYSGVTNTQQTFAHNEAIQAAAQALLPKAEARIARMSPAEQNRYHQKQASAPGWLTKRIADELVSRNLQTDSFTQRFDRPNYTVWREALLIDADDAAIERIATALVSSLNVQVAHQRATWFSFLGLGGLILGTYVFLNMATKGYYAWMLRLAAIAGIAGVIGFLVFLA